MWYLLVVGFIGAVNCAPQLQSIQPAGASQPHQPGNGQTPIPIIAQVDNQGFDGTFNSSFETGNGIRQQQTGFVKRIVVPRYEGDGLGDSAKEHEADVQVQVGSYSYTAPDGTVISLSYTADENGFQPVGDHLPTAPPATQAISQSEQGRTNSNINLRFTPNSPDASQPSAPANFEVLKP